MAVTSSAYPGARGCQRAGSGAAGRDAHAELLRADYTGSVAVKYIKRGYTYLCRHAITLLLVPVAASLVVSCSGLLLAHRWRPQP